MKLGLIFGTAILLACATGCAANPALQAQVNSLQQTANEQDAQIRELSAKAAKCNGQLVYGDLKQDASDLATSAWSWLSSVAGDARKSATPIITCYRDGADDVHSLEDSRKLMLHCYDQAHQ